MQKLRNKNKLILLAVVVVPIVIAFLMNSQQVLAQTDNQQPLPVQIVNPLPLPTTGSSEVSGTVTATQGGTWNVSISGNTAATPLFVRDVNEAANQPAINRQQCVTSGTRCDFSSLYTIPPNKRLVVEYASAGGLLPAGQHYSCAFFPSVGGSANVPILMRSSNASAGSGTSAIETEIGQAMRFYADPSTTLVGECTRDSDVGDAVFDLEFNGYLVDIP
jgi:hypothetical protein